jgi:hypothetical protein
MSDDSRTTITAKQLDRLKELESKIKLTEKQALERNTLQQKRDAKPELSKGAKSFIQKKALHDKYSIEDTIESRYLDKGLICEDEAIQIYASVTGKHLIFKNEEGFHNDYVAGTPDLILDDMIVDVKCSWSIDSFPWFDTTLNRNYYWQLQAYMWLTGKSKSELVYVLVNTPDHLFQQELQREIWKVKDTQGVLDISAEVESDIYEELILKHNFDRIPFEKRVKVFEIEADILEQSKIKQKVELAREYYNEVIETI